MKCLRTFLAAGGCASLLLLVTLIPADAQVFVNPGVVNPWTGHVHRNVAVRNPWTGRVRTRTTIHDPWTGTTVCGHTVYNPWTGRWGVTSGRRWW
jgi:hypothetical protein